MLSTHQYLRKVNEYLFIRFEYKNTNGCYSGASATQAEKRQKIIEESKYLGGDMEHTHLVKGLDYALLDKVRAEINNKETQDEDLEAVADEEVEK